MKKLLIFIFIIFTFNGYTQDFDTYSYKAQSVRLDEAYNITCNSATIYYGTEVSTGARNPVSLMLSTDGGNLYSTISNFTSTGKFYVEYTISGLSSNTTYYYQLCYVDYDDFNNRNNFSSVLSFTTNNVLTVQTAIIATEISDTYIEVGGGVSYDGGETVTSFGACWNTTGSPTLADNYTTAYIGDETGFVVHCSPLSQNTTYYFRTYAINDCGTGYGNEVSFTTTGGVSLPTVTTNTASNITQLSALLSGTLVDDGGGSITEYGLNIYESDQTTLFANIITSSGFSSNYIGLCFSSSYYTQAYAINSAGTGYGEKVNFSTTNYSTLNYGYLFNQVNGTAITDSTSAVNAINTIFDNGISTTTSSYTFNKIPSITTGEYLYNSGNTCIANNNSEWTIWYTGSTVSDGAKLNPLILIHWESNNKSKIYSATTFRRYV